MGWSLEGLAFWFFFLCEIARRSTGQAALAACGSGRVAVGCRSDGVGKLRRKSVEVMTGSRNGWNLLDCVGTGTVVERGRITTTTTVVFEIVLDI